MRIESLLIVALAAHAASAGACVGGDPAGDPGADDGGGGGGGGGADGGAPGADADHPGGDGLTRLVSVGSNGYTIEAEALVPAMASLASVFVHSGDIDFSFADLNVACERWPGLAHYCDPDGTPARTGEEIRAAYRAMMAPLFEGGIPAHVVVGNHEKDGVPYGMAQPYYEETYGLSAPYRSAFDVDTAAGPARVVLLDTTESLEPGQPQRAWLEGELSAHQDDAWLILIGHGQPYSQSKPSLGMREHCALFRQYGVDVYVGGHPLAWERTHQLDCDAGAPDGVVAVDTDDTYARGAGTVFVSNGGGGMHVCGTWDNPVPRNLENWIARIVCHDPEVMDSELDAYTFLTLEWSEDGETLGILAVDRNGNVLDRASIAR